MTYSSSLALGRRQTFAGRNQNAISFRATGKRLGPISNSVILVVLACLLGLLYLTQVTKTNAYGYQINNLQQQQTELAQQHDELVVSAAEAQSVSHVQNSSVAKAMVSTTPSAVVQN